MKTRPPVVVIVGHIDHGKTTLLDYIRKTNVAKQEAGMITQSIGAYEIEHKGKKITFIDTPGHEAFSQMRAHGVKVADLAVLVVAADDGVKPQTKDALTHIREAGVPFVVAINKVDLDSANIEKTKQELTKAGVLLEGEGGNVSYQLISALKGDGVGELLDLITLAAEVEKLAYDPDRAGQGVVVKSSRDAQRGIIVGAVIKNGTVHVGDRVSTATAYGKVKSLENFLGELIKHVEPSSPVLIFGFTKLPDIGELFTVVEETPEELIHPSREEPLPLPEEEEYIKLILKANEAGSLEALKGIVDKLSSETPMTIVKIGVGNVYENDVKLADTLKALIVGFNTKIDKAALNLAKAHNVIILTSPVIYELEEELREYLRGVAVVEERIIEILATFGTPKGKQQVVGGRVIKGYVKNQESFTVVYDDKSIGSGKILNLQLQKEDISQAEEGQEVGLLVESDEVIKEGYHLLFV